MNLAQAIKRSLTQVGVTYMGALMEKMKRDSKNQ
jgi:hypothetical protein